MRKKMGRERGWAHSLEGASRQPCVAGGRYSIRQLCSTSDDVLHQISHGVHLHSVLGWQLKLWLIRGWPEIRPL